MGFLNTPHKKKSALLTSMITLLLLLFFSWIGLSYFDPPISYGMEVNFGTTNQGQGNTQPKLPPKQVEQQKVQPKTQAPRSTPKAVAIQTPKVATQKEPSVPVVKKETNTTPKPKVEKKKTPPKEVQEEVKKVEPPKPTKLKGIPKLLAKPFLIREVLPIPGGPHKPITLPSAVGWEIHLATTSKIFDLASS